MDRQAVHDLLQCFLEKRGVQGIDLNKELSGLLAYGVAKGCFVDPNTGFDDEEWRNFGDKLWEASLEDDKAAKKLGKPWRAVINALKQHQAEQRAARAAAERLGEPKPREDTCPLPPSMNAFTIPVNQIGSLFPPSSPMPSPPPLLQPPPPVPEEWPPVPQGGMSGEIKLGDMCGAKVLAAEREKLWREISAQAMAAGESAAAGELAESFSVTYTPAGGNNINVEVTNLDWKLLSQLRATISESGIQGEPTRQILNYIWGGNILLPTDIKSITRLILTQHQQLLFNAHWQAACQDSVAEPRRPADPLHGVTLEELLGTGQYLRPVAQALLGPDKVKESMRLARTALNRIKSPGGIPSYMSIKQGREESFGAFIDRVASAIQAAGVPEYMHGALLKQCALQNSNATTRSIIITLPGNWSIEEALERLTQIPSGPQAMLVEAVRELGASLKEQAQSTSTQVLAALASLQASATRSSGRGLSRIRCFRCGTAGHTRKECTSGAVWCPRCKSDSHNTAACHRGSGNGRTSAKGPRAATQVASSMSNAFPAQTPPLSGQPQPEASAWTWQPQ
ncbi:GAK6 protein, partial [Nyctibius bracteatus]|nr:GAK6 protein [Nyctibius bracteatus]